ncbi:MAG TPA: hypothetical protein VHI13_22305 [Candidatus Kapabacteria bacterium]|nr:hypothetical protein [Candidatus Kapabacteria bacterium]
MKRTFIWLSVLTGTALLLYGGTWFYYSRQEVYRESFSASIVPQAITNEIEWIPVTWIRDSISDRSAMFLPIRIDTITKPFFAQFDLGTPVTDFMDITQRFACLKKHLCTLDHMLRYQSRPEGLAGITIGIGYGSRTRYVARHIPIYDRIQMDSLEENDTMYTTKVGNIGYDFIDGRILVMDFAHSRIAVTDTLRGELAARVRYIGGALVHQFPIYLPITINGSERLIKYDNGSSAFTLLLPRQQWEGWRQAGGRVDTFPGSAWGRPMELLRSNSGVRIAMLGRDRTMLPIWTSTADEPEGGSFLRSVKAWTDGLFANVYPGWMGNEYFRNDVLVFDARHNRLGVIEPGHADSSGHGPP